MFQIDACWREDPSVCLDACAKIRLSGPCQTLPDACARCILSDICQLDFPYFSSLKNWEAWRNNPSVENIKGCVNNSLLWLIEPGEVWWGVGQMPSRNGPDYKRPSGPPLMWAHRATLRGKHSKHKHTYEWFFDKNRYKMWNGLAWSWLDFQHWNAWRGDVVIDGKELRKYYWDGLKIKACKNSLK